MWRVGIELNGAHGALLASELSLLQEAPIDDNCSVKVNTVKTVVVGDHLMVQSKLQIQIIQIIFIITLSGFYLYN